jgi:hypothetical protein
MFLKVPYGVHEKATKMEVASIQLITSHRKTNPLTSAKAAKIFLGYQLCQLVKNHSYFREHPCPSQTSAIFIE